MTEYVCADCGRHVISFGEPGELPICATCDWIRTYVAWDRWRHRRAPVKAIAKLVELERTSG